jgi:hypothetical protein
LADPPRLKSSLEEQQIEWTWDNASIEHDRSVPLEELHSTFMSLGLRERGESTEVAASACFWIFLS